MADPLNYAHGGESNDYKWTQLAFTLQTAGRLTAALSAPAGGRVTASGDCPRCNHDVDYSFDETIVVPQGSGGTLSTDITNEPPQAGSEHGDSGTESVRYVTVPILCQCHEDHPGRPATSRGCGIVFNTDLPVP